MRTRSFDNWFRVVLATALAGFLTGCAKPEIILEARNEARVDFSGNWELHYGLSDQLEENIYNEFLLARRQLRQESTSLGQRAGPIVIVGSPRANTGSAIVGLGRMAEMISRTTELEIIQSEESITIKRANDFPLTCTFSPNALANDDLLGNESCGWDDHQLVFRINLPDGTRVRHRLTLGPAGNNLNVATTVASRRAPKPFTLDRVYQRFEPIPDPYNCKPTLDRGLVCWALGDGSPGE